MFRKIVAALSVAGLLVFGGLVSVDKADSIRPMCIDCWEMRAR